MQRLIYTCLFFIFSINAYAQETFDFMLFRPGVQYLYENTEFSVTTGSPIIGMRLEGTDSEGFSAAYLSASYDEFGPCTDLIPSFAGRAVYQANNRTIMAMDSARTDLLVLENGAAPGVSWAATPSITAQVDSIREETFWSLTDDVKYISFRNTSDGSTVALTIRISRNYGMLTGTYFREIRTTNSPLTLVSLSQPRIGPQLPRLRDVIQIPAGMEMNIKRVRSSDLEGRSTSITQEQQLTITNSFLDEVSGKAKIEYIKNEYQYTRRPPDFLFQDQSFDENVRDSFVYDLAVHSFLDAQPGEAVFPTFDWRGNTQRSPQMGVLRAKVFDCYGLGIGLPWLTQWDETNNCWIPPQESGLFGYYFGKLGGPYFTGGYSGFYNNDLVGVFGDNISCGESLNLTNPLGEVRLGEPFDWQLFRPGVQYLYDKPGFNDPPEYLGMKLTGNGEEAIYESLRGEDINCRQLVPSFAGVRIRQQPELTTLLFYSDSLHLRTAAQIGTSWMANDTTVATVDSVMMQTFFGVADSVKHISFRHALTGEGLGKSISLSKNYGLLNATYFYDLASNASFPLAGLSQPEVGLQAPSFQSLTNFAPGDEFHTRIINTIEDMDRVFYQTVETQATVIGTERTGDSLVYVFIKKNELTFRGIPPGLNATDSVFRTNRMETIVYDLREQPWLGGQASQLFPGQFGDQNIFQVIPGGCLGAYALLDLHQRAQNGECYNWMSGLIGHSGIYRNQVAGPFEQSVEGSHVINRLLYFNNATCSEGTPLDFDGLIDGVNGFRPDERIRLYPNPNNGRINLEIPLDLGPVSLTVFSITGQRLLSEAAVIGNRSISIAPFPPGMYTVVFYNAAGAVGRRRVVLSR